MYVYTFLSRNFSIFHATLSLSSRDASHFSYSYLILSYLIFKEDKKKERKKYSRDTSVPRHVCNELEKKKKNPLLKKRDEKSLIDFFCDFLVASRHRMCFLLFEPFSPKENDVKRTRMFFSIFPRISLMLLAILLG